MLTTRGAFRKPPFDPRAAFIAAREIKWGPSGQERFLKPGDPFDLDALGCDQFKAKQLYRVRHIAMILDEDTRRPKLAADVWQGAAPPVAPPTLTLKRRWAGKWAVVDADGKIVHDDLSKLEAEAIVERCDATAGIA